MLLYSVVLCEKLLGSDGVWCASWNALLSCCLDLMGTLAFTFQRDKIFLHRSLVKIQYCGDSLWPGDSVLGIRPPGLEFRVLCLQGSVISFISLSSVVLLAQFSLYLHKCGLKPHLFIFISFIYTLFCIYYVYVATYSHLGNTKHAKQTFKKLVINLLLIILYYRILDIYSV